MAKKNTSEDINELYMKFQNLQENAEQIEQQLAYVNSELENLKYYSEGIKELEKETKVLEGYFPIADGIFVKGTLTDTKNCYVNVGNGTVIKMTIPETLSFIEKKMAEIQDSGEILAENITIYNSEIQRLADKINSIQAEEEVNFNV